MVVEVAASEDGAEVLVASSALRSERRAAIKALEPFPVLVKTLPALEEIASGHVEVSDLRPIEVEDLLGRDPVAPERELVVRPVRTLQAFTCSGSRTGGVHCVPGATGGQGSAVVIGGQGVFVKEVQQAVLDGRADVAVHSAKDLPSVAHEALALGAFLARRDAADALVGRSLADLHHGATVATGSVRRRAQLVAVRPDLEFVELRGNIATRLSKVPESGSIVMAVAALQVLGMTDVIAERLDPAVFVPGSRSAPGRAPRPPPRSRAPPRPRRQGC